jgi:antitoxin ParD1/3/4
MATMNISLPETMKDWVEAQIQTGRYGSISDYIRRLIRNDRERAAADARMQELVTETLEPVSTS